MNKKEIEIQRAMILFERNSVHCQNPLRVALSLMKFFKFDNYLNYSYLEKEPASFNNMKVIDYILLDTVPMGLSQSKESFFNQRMKKVSNIYLKEMYESLPSMTSQMIDISNQKKKLIGLFKAILKDSKFIILDSPESYLSEQQVEVLINALNFEMAKNSRTILVHSSKKNKWQNYMTHLIKQGQSSFSLEELTPQAQAQATSDNISQIDNEQSVEIADPLQKAA